ncbi:MAG: hypothetical protein ACOX52_04925 [Verrucomicrobiota bacterium]
MKLIPPALPQGRKRGCCSISDDQNYVEFRRVVQDRNAHLIATRVFRGVASPVLDYPLPTQGGFQLRVERDIFRLHLFVRAQEGAEWTHAGNTRVSGNSDSLRWCAFVGATETRGQLRFAMSLFKPQPLEAQEIEVSPTDVSYTPVTPSAGLNGSRRSPSTTSPSRPNVAQRAQRHRTEPKGALPAEDEELWVIVREESSRLDPVADGPDWPGSGTMSAVLGEGAESVPMPLKKTDVFGRIDGHIASVRVEQQYENPYGGALDMRRRGALRGARTRASRGQRGVGGWHGGGRGGGWHDAGRALDVRRRGALRGARTRASRGQREGADGMVAGGHWTCAVGAPCGAPLHGHRAGSGEGGWHGGGRALDMRRGGALRGARTRASRGQREGGWHGGGRALDMRRGGALRGALTRASRGQRGGGWHGGGRALDMRRGGALRGALTRASRGQREGGWHGGGRGGGWHGGGRALDMRRGGALRGALTRASRGQREGGWHGGGRGGGWHGGGRALDMRRGGALRGALTRASRGQRGGGWHDAGRALDMRRGAPCGAPLHGHRAAAAGADGMMAAGGRMA